jgi:uncharacterized protein (TIGR00255 family)
MTGFGMAETDTEKFTVKVEIRSLNSKFLDLNLKMPRQWQHKELELRRELGKWIERGTAQVFVNLQYKLMEDKVSPLNQDVALYYLNEVKQLSDKSGWQSSELLNNIFLIPNITQNSEETPSEEDWKQILATAEKAYTQFDGFRKTEGGVLEKELLGLCQSILASMEALSLFEEERIKNVKERLQKELHNLHSEMADKNRFEQELIYYLEKLDISEEKSRLRQHCAYFEETLNSASTGKKLGFIAQEMGREINTIGSKSNHSLMQRKVVEMKDELEKIKEQINNVL